MSEDKQDITPQDALARINPLIKELEQYGIHIEAEWLIATTTNPVFSKVNELDHNSKQYLMYKFLWLMGFCQGVKSLTRLSLEG